MASTTPITIDPLSYAYSDLQVMDSGEHGTITRVGATSVDYQPTVPAWSGVDSCNIAFLNAAGEQITVSRTFFHLVNGLIPSKADSVVLDAPIVEVSRVGRKISYNLLNYRIGLNSLKLEVVLREGGFSGIPETNTVLISAPVSTLADGTVLESNVPAGKDLGAVLLVPVLTTELGGQRIQSEGQSRPPASLPDGARAVGSCTIYINESPTPTSRVLRCEEINRVKGWPQARWSYRLSTSSGARTAATDWAAASVVPRSVTVNGLSGGSDYDFFIEVRDGSETDYLALGSFTQPSA